MNRGGKRGDVDGLPPPPDDPPPPGDFPPGPPPEDGLPPPPGDAPPNEMMSAEQLDFFQRETGADAVTAEQWVNRYPERAVEMYRTSQQSAQPTTIPPPSDEPPPGTWPGQQTLEEHQLAFDRISSDVAAKRSQREQSRGTPHEAQLVAELQELEATLADAQSRMLAALDEQEDHLQASGAGGMAAKVVEQAQTRQLFNAFCDGKDYMERSDVVASIHHLGFECDEDYCTQLLQAFAYGAPVMDIDSFARMWAHLAPDYVLEAPPPGTAPPAGQSYDGAAQQPKQQPEPEPEPSGTDLPVQQLQPNPAEDVTVDEEWKQRRLEELKAEEEQRLREEARQHARTAQHEDDLAHMLRDEDILRALFSRIDPGSTGRTSRVQWLKFLAADVSSFPSYTKALCMVLSRTVSLERLRLQQTIVAATNCSLSL